MDAIKTAAADETVPVRKLGSGPVYFGEVGDNPLGSALTVAGPSFHIVGGILISKDRAATVLATLLGVPFASSDVLCVAAGIGIKNPPSGRITVKAGTMPDTSAYEAGKRYEVNMDTLQIAILDGVKSGRPAKNAVNNNGTNTVSSTRYDTRLGMVVPAVSEADMRLLVELGAATTLQEARAKLVVRAYTARQGAAQVRYDAAKAAITQAEEAMRLATAAYEAVPMDIAAYHAAVTAADANDARIADEKLLFSVNSALPAPSALAAKDEQIARLMAQVAALSVNHIGPMDSGTAIIAALSDGNTPV